MDQWFSAYEKFIHDHGLANRPAQIWNCDESGFDLQGRAGKILGPSAAKEKPYRVITGTKEHITVLPCFNACGQWMPPYILFVGKRIPKTYNPLDGGVPGSVFSMTEKGYMDTPAFYMWFANHFITQLPPQRPVVLLVDSHESHIDLATFELAKKNNVHIFALLKNATHLVQPADVGLFGAMKQTWYKHVRIYNQQNPNTDITKKNFCSVFKSTWEEVMRPSILVDAFRKSGIFPLDRSKITDDQVKPSLVYSTSSVSATSPTSTTVVWPLTTINTQSITSSCADSASSTSVVSTAALRETNPPSTASLQTSSLPCEKTKTAFEALESTLQTPTKLKYRRRVKEGYDLPGSPVFMAWKHLYESSKENEQPPVNTNTHSSLSLSTSTTPLTSQPSASPRLSAYQTTSQQVSPILDDILVYPSAIDHPKKTNNKLSLPNFMTSEASMKILLDEKLKKSRELAEKQKRLREREEKKEAKKKKMEEKKKTPKKTAAKRKATKLQQSVECDENTCKICLAQYMLTDDEDFPWVMCDECKFWMHIECIPIGVDLTPIDNGEQFFCHDCTY